jgi:murein L,D-transpeptidase YafK
MSMVAMIRSNLLHDTVALLVAMFAALGPCVAAADAAVKTGPGLADYVLVEKSARKLHLLRDGQVIKSFDISLGLSPDGAKRMEGDFRTPEGRYFVEMKNPNSDFFLSIKISYPGPADRQRARQLGVDPGGQIMIHGHPNEPRYPISYYAGRDWTDGCIAVSNSDMVDIWLMTTTSTPIEIRP